VFGELTIKVISSLTVKLSENVFDYNFKEKIKIEPEMVVQR